MTQWIKAFNLCATVHVQIPNRSLVVLERVSNPSMLLRYLRWPFLFTKFFYTCFLEGQRYQECKQQIKPGKFYNVFEYKQLYNCQQVGIAPKSYRYTMTNIFQELFIPTLNGIAVSDQYVSFTPIVLHAGLNDQLRRMQTNKTLRNDENRRM